MTINKIRFRSDTDGKVILQVRFKKRRAYGYEYGDERDEGEWRDATVEDLIEVAQFTRAHDYLDGVIGSLQSSVLHLQQNVSGYMERASSALAREAQ